jgi:large subunit ribosomal protein L22
MEIRSIAKSVRIGPRKVRLVADMIRSRSIEDALLALQSTPKRAALPVEKALKSAIANAVNNAGLDVKSLVIESINVSEGPALKRFMPSTRGRTHPYKRRSSNIRIILKTKDIKQTAKKTQEKKTESKDAPVVEEKEVTAKKPSLLGRLRKGGKPKK